MKKILLFLLVAMTSLFVLASCDSDKETSTDANQETSAETNEGTNEIVKPYEKEAGVYNLYSMTGLDMSLYEYYRIILNADGTCVVESKAAGVSQLYSATATYSITDGKISIVTVSGPTSITEIYDYVDGEIHMPEQNISGITFSAKFKR